MARRAIRDRVGHAVRLEPVHLASLEVVASELLGAALETGRPGSLTLSVEFFPRLTSVRVHCPSRVELRDEPFGVRERVLEGFAFAWGRRDRADGSVDLWAEIARGAPTR